MFSGKVPLRDLLSKERPKIMKSIEREVDALARPSGIAIVDVRIIRTSFSWKIERLCLVA